MARSKSKPPAGRRFWQAALGLVALVASGWGALQWNSARQITEARRSSREAFEKKDWATLRDAASEWMLLEPKDVTATLMYADAAISLGDHDAADRALAAVRTEQPGYTSVLERRIKLAFHHLNQPEDGVQLCEELIRIQPSGQLAWHYLLYYQALTIHRPQLRSRTLEAIRNRAEEPQHYAWLILLDDLVFRNVGAEFEAWLRNNPNSEDLQVASLIHSLEDLFQREGVARDGSGLDDSWLRRVMELSGKFPENSVLLAFQLRRAAEAGETERVAELLSRVPAAAGDDHVFWRYRAWYQLQQQNLDEAIADIEQAIKLHPLSPDARNLRAEIRRVSGASMTQVMADQDLASEGKAIQDDLRRMTNLQSLEESLLRRIAAYSESCEEWEITAGLHRRILPTESPQ